MPRFTGRQRAYEVPLNGKIVRSFLVYANSGAEAREIMEGDRSSCQAMDDHIEETSVGQAIRMPSEDLGDEDY